MVEGGCPYRRGLWSKVGVPIVEAKVGVPIVEARLELAARGANVWFIGARAGDLLRVKFAGRDSLAGARRAIDDGPVDLQLAPGIYDSIVSGTTFTIADAANVVDVREDRRPPGRAASSRGAARLARRCHPGHPPAQGHRGRKVPRRMGRTRSRRRAGAGRVGRGRLPRSPVPRHRSMDRARLARDRSLAVPRSGSRPGRGSGAALAASRCRPRRDDDLRAGSRRPHSRASLGRWTETDASGNRWHGGRLERHGPHSEAYGGRSRAEHVSPWQARRRGITSFSTIWRTTKVGVPGKSRLSLEKRCGSRA